MPRRHTTRAEDRAFLQKRLADLHRDWQVGDATLPYKTRVIGPDGRSMDAAPTTIVRFDGETAHLADGTAMHRSHLRRPENR